MLHKLKYWFKHNKSDIITWAVFIAILVVVTIGINSCSAKNDETINGTKPGTLTYRVYYTDSHIVEKKVYDVYSYSLDSHRGSNCLQVHKQNCSTWVPVFKHIGLLDIVEETTAVIEIVSFY